MRTHTANGFPAPPVDIRYLQKPKAQVVAETRSSVVSFLMEIYLSVAETLPDFRDDSFDVDTTAFAGCLDIEDPDHPPWANPYRMGEVELQNDLAFYRDFL